MAAALHAGAEEPASDADPREAGPALRDALAAVAADGAAGRERLAEIERRHPIIADHAAHQALESLAREQAHAALLERAAAFTATYPESPLRGRVAELEGEAALQLRDFARARAGYELARRSARTREERAQLSLAIARTHGAQGDLSREAALLLEVWRDHAPTRAAEQAIHQLALLPQGMERIAPTDHAVRCRELGAAFWNEQALRACDEALAAKTLPAKTRAQLSALRAELLFRDRQYVEAERAFAALPDSRENRFWRARAQARSGRIDDAKRAFEALGQQSDSWGARALFLAGTLYEDDDVTTARARYEQSLARAATPELRIEARWRLAWRAVLEQRWSDAASGLAALARDTADPIEALRARYWEARALDALGNAAGKARLAAIARDFGFTYYGQRAATLARGAEPENAPAASEPGLEQGDALPPEALLRPRILLESGLIAEAGAEARALARRVRLRADRLALAALLQDAGEFNAAQRVVLDAYGLALTAAPAAGDADLWWSAYPRAYASDVERAAKAHGIPPELLFAVMREESGFQPDALSVVGARGLVQIMPETGRRLAAGLGSAQFHADELFVPARNLELGASYLAQLLARFGGRASAAVASYNAGPDAVERWLKQQPHLEEDAWIEAIAYDQTRTYVKRVLRSYAIYQALY